MPKLSRLPALSATPRRDLALGLGMEWSATHMAPTLGFDLFGQFTGAVSHVDPWA